MESTYKFSTNDVPVLSIVLVVSIAHQGVILQNRHPVLVVFHFFPRVGRAGRRHELLDRDRVSVKVLERDIGEEGDFVVLVERKVDVEGAGALGLR